jgi:hypothetical protein
LTTTFVVPTKNAVLATITNQVMNACFWTTSQKATKKLDSTRFIGPFPIIQTHVNVTLTIQHTPHVTDRVNIREVKPYFRLPVSNK